MSSKHFTAIAAAVRFSRDNADTTAERRIIDELAHNLSRSLVQFNARFDGDKFLTACGVQS